MKKTIKSVNRRIQLNTFYNLFINIKKKILIAVDRGCLIWNVENQIC